MNASIPSVVATIDRSLSGREELIVSCPFCGRMHRHGAAAGLGSRMSHCLREPRIYELIAPAPDRELHGLPR